MAKNTATTAKPSNVNAKSAKNAKAPKAPTPAAKNAKAPKVAAPVVPMQTAEERTQELVSKLALLKTELNTAIGIHDAANQASIWQFNAMGASDSFVDLKEFGELQNRLAEASKVADALRDESNALVITLRARVRTLSQELGSHVNADVMKRATAEAEALARKAASAKAEPNKAPTAEKMKEVEEATKKLKGAPNVASAKNAKTTKTSATEPKTKLPTFKEFAESKGLAFPPDRSSKQFKKVFAEFEALKAAQA